MLQLSNVTIFLGLKGPNWLQSFEAQAIFLEIHFTREEYFDLSSFEKGTVVFSFQFQFSETKLNVVSLLFIEYGDLNCYHVL